MQHLTEKTRVLRREVVHASHVAAAAHQNLEWPNRPEGHQGDECVILKQQALALALLDCNVVAEQATLLRAPVRALRHKLLPGLDWNRRCRPDLAVRMGVTSSHHGAAVFKNLHMVDGLDAAQLAELFHPRLDDRFGLFRSHGGQRKIVPRRKADYLADARLALRHQQPESFHVEALTLRSGL